MWLYPGFAPVFLFFLSSGSGHSDASTEDFTQAAAGDGESGDTPGP